MTILEFIERNPWWSMAALGLVLKTIDSVVDRVALVLEELLEHLDEGRRSR